MAILIPAASSTVIFQGRSNTAQTLTTANTTYAVNLQVHDFDDLGGHSTTTQTSRYVIKRAGLYSATGSVLFGSSSSITAGTQQRVPSIMKNGTIVGGSTTWGVYPAINTLLNVPVAQVLVNCAVNDYIEIGAFSGLAGSTTAGDSGNGTLLRVDFIR